jgi:hypothetical protein
MKRNSRAVQYRIKGVFVREESVMTTARKRFVDQFADSREPNSNILSASLLFWRFD